MLDANERMPFWKRVIYGSGNFAANLMNCTVGTYISYYYTEVAGLPIAAVGMILLLCRLLDGVTDLTMGVVIENTKSKNGKARPWVFRMAIPFGVAVFLMFFSPNWGTTGKIIFAAATYMAGIALVYTAVSVPYNTLSALITKNTDDRTSLATMRQFFGFMGPLVITTITLPIINALGGKQSAWSVLTAVYGIIGIVLYLSIYFTTKEITTGDAATSTASKQPKENGSNIKAVKALVKNQYWLIVLATQLLIFIMYGMSGGVNVYYCKYLLGDDNLYSFIGIASQLPNILLCFVVPGLAKKFGKRNVSMAGCFLAVVGALIMLINPASLSIIIVSTVIRTIGMAPICICVFAMVGDTATYGEWKTRVKNEGMIFSAVTFAEKVGYALGGAATAFTLALGGFVGGAATQSESAINAMKVAMIGFPLAIAVLVILLLKPYHLDKEYPTILKDLEARAKEQTN